MIARQLLRIAIPLGLAGAIRYVVELSTLYWTGRLGIGAIAIVTALAYFLSILRMVAMTTSAGTAAVIGRHLGEDRGAEAAGIAQRVTAIAPALGIVTALITVPAIPLVLRHVGLAPELHVGAAPYLAILLIGLPFAFGNMALHAALVGLGHVRVSVAVNGIALSVTATATPLLVFGTKLGLAGAALAQVLGDAAGFLFGLRRLGKATAGAPLSVRQRLAPSRALLPVLRVGAPLTVDAIFHASVGLALIASIARFGTDYVAAQGTEEKLTQILNLPVEGLAPATATLVGFHVGRGDLARTRATILTALGLMFVTAAIGVAVLLAFAGPVLRLFSEDAGYVGVGVRILAAAACSLVFLGVRDLMDGSFGGIGNTLPPLLVGTSLTLLRLPLARWLVERPELGGLGVTWAINATLIGQGVLLLVILFALLPRAILRVRAADARDAVDLPAASDLADPARVPSRGHP